MSHEHLHELEDKPSRSTLDIVSEVFARLDATGMAFASAEEKARRFLALLSLEHRVVVESIPMPRVIR
jgi:hypothetical protein